jgi:AAA+ superfamily predicted ATPase
MDQGSNAMTADAKIAVPAVSREGAEILLDLVRLRARRHVLWMRSDWARTLDRPADSLAVCHAEIEHLLGDRGEATMRRSLFFETHPVAQQLSEDSNTAEAEFARDPGWSRLRREFGLSRLEMHLLALAVAVQIDPSLRRVYAYLHDDPAAAYASPWLAAALFTEETPALIGPQSPLVRWRLARPNEGVASSWESDAAWIADPYVVLWLLGRAVADPALEPAARLLPKGTAAEVCLYPGLLGSILEFLGGVEGRAAEIELTGETGAGKRTLAAQAAAAIGAGLVAVDAAQLLPPDLPAAEAAERIFRAIRMAQLTGSLLYWDGGERTSLRVWQATGGYSGVMLFGAAAPGCAASRSPAARRSFVLPRLCRDLRIQLWQRFSDRPVPRLIADGAVKPADIVRAAEVAPAGAAAVTELLQDDGRAAPGDVFTAVPCPFTWDDIVLQHGVREHLRELEQQVRLRPLVYEEWGFERLCPMGRGITALFAGPSGSGKTMAAQVLARSLDLKLLRVDLAGVVNKYIGETEKRLKQVFDDCERANVLLFFDEADALFGQRTQVKDAHDRFANIEIDYLLQRMEAFEGVAILATNRKGDLDKAFLRRIRFIVDFLPPGPAERLALWQRALTPRTEPDESILGFVDCGFLAQKLNMTGADIASAALNAAFLARAQGTRITMDHILHAARREMSKHGIVVRPGEWGG